MCLSARFCCGILAAAAARKNVYQRRPASRICNQFSCALQRGFSDGTAAEQARDFAHFRVLVKGFDGRKGRFLVAMLKNAVAMCAAGRNLRQMRDTDNLMRLCDLLELLSDDAGSDAADAVVDLIKNQRREAIFASGLSG